MAFVYQEYPLADINDLTSKFDTFLARADVINNGWSAEPTKPARTVAFTHTADDLTCTLAISSDRFSTVRMGIGYDGGTSFTGTSTLRGPYRTATHTNAGNLRICCGQNYFVYEIELDTRVYVGSLVKCTPFEGGAAIWRFDPGNINYDYGGAFIYNGNYTGVFYLALDGSGAGSFTNLNFVNSGNELISLSSRVIPSDLIISASLAVSSTVVSFGIMFKSFDTNNNLYLSDGSPDFRIASREFVSHGQDLVFNGVTYSVFVPKNGQNSGDRNSLAILLNKAG
ncbi:MAG: hypothetical protein Unbinned4162contig1001_69 [Prokaryotic dsDNA virus sp.]|nr:MAG: hypothetical protein Unbinned4162contig1001_69 [Prokaryotic dsDNA virus sp.]|tara:strand:- start:40002 stop:40850 length:849 start_codon:yes stop_codon:yes gene_type:complete